MSTLPRLNALVVDDDGDIREVLLDLLAEEGYDATAVSSLPMARDYLRASADIPPHVVLLDYLLDGPVPGAVEGQGGNTHASGLALLREVEGDPLLKRHCYVLLTATDPARLAADDARLLEALCVTIIRKPFGIDDQLRAVGDAARRLPVAT